jgi:dihydrofolate reductase
MVAPSFPVALAAAVDVAEAGGAGEVMVIGGGEIYALAMSEAERLYITHVHTRPEGDTCFPAIDPAVWRPVASEDVPAGEKDSAPTTFVTYERV